jgi:hypothetical protein
MVNCEADRCETRSLRGFGDDLPKKFPNRIESRIVMKAYGTSVARYTSAKQLFCAIRDAIAGKNYCVFEFSIQLKLTRLLTGHMELFKKGMLHRDVSPYNVLFGNPGAEPGYRGILIDFDISIWRRWNKPADGQIVSSSFHSRFPSVSR